MNANKKKVLYFLPILILMIIPTVLGSVTFNSAYPNNQEANYNPQLRVNLTSTNNITVVFETNEKGFWEQLGNYTGRSGVYTQHTQGRMNINYKKYYWRVRVLEGTTWTTKNYNFTARPFVLKWSYNLDQNSTIGPLAVDINKDGIYEVFATVDNYITAFNGATGQRIWQYYNGELRDHSPFEIVDLNNDGLPEIVSSMNNWTLALHANNGSVYWRVPLESQDNYLVVVDTEGNGYPYVYISSDDVLHGENGTGRLRKLNGTNGEEIAQTFAWRPCWGGLSAADANNDGKFEIYMTDRKAFYELDPPPLGGLGKGMQAYDADNLSLIWKEDRVTCSSHVMALYDVNNDNILEAIAFQQNGGGIYVVDGATGQVMPGKYADRLNMKGHSQFSLWDIDSDNNVELISASRTPAKVWDIGNWSMEAVLSDGEDVNYSEPPKMGDIIGDSKLEIIGTGGDIRVYNSSYVEIAKIWGANSVSSTLVQDIDGDDMNELVVISYKGYVRAYETSAYAPTPRVRTNNQYYSERRLGAAVYIPPPGAPQPFVKEETPSNLSREVNINPDLSVKVIDYRHDKLNINISVLNKRGEWVLCSSYLNVDNGIYSCKPTIFNETDTKYFWKVTAVDFDADKIQITAIYSFTTKTDVETPKILNETPRDYAEKVQTSIKELKFSLFDNQSDLMNFTVTTSPNVGSAIGKMVPNGNYSVNISNLNVATTYIWTVDVTDGRNSKSKSFTFTTKGMNNLIVNILGNGTVTGNEQNPYLPGANVTLSANSGGSGWIFKRWLGDISSSSNPLIITMDDDKNISALFYETPNSVIVDPNFDLSNDSQDLINNDLFRQDWYESRNEFKNLLTLDTRNISGNSGKKAKLTGSSMYNTYLTQDFSMPLNETFDIQWDLYVDNIINISALRDQAAIMMIGDHSTNDSRGPNVGSIQNFVWMAVTKTGGAENGTAALMVQTRSGSYANISLINLDTWNTIRITGNLVKDTYDVYLNGELKAQNVTSRTAKSSVTHISFAQWNDGAGTFFVDNVLIGGSSNPCNPGETRLCSLQGGVCFGFNETCSSQGIWTGCNYGLIPSYETIEISCDTLDNDCDGSIDENLKNTYYKDFDIDTYGNANSNATSCTLPQGYVEDNTDCNDNNHSIYPGATEIQDGVDNNCDGRVDEGFIIGEWGYKKKITIDHSKVSGNLEEFPVLIDITDSDLDDRAQPDGEDIYFTLSDNETKLSHEIETYDGGNGHLVAWVNLPVLSSTVDTVIYMYYGNPDVSSQEDAEGVWDSDYVSVQHLQEIVGPIIDDSSANGNDGNANANMVLNVEGKINGADAFDGVDDRITMSKLYTNERQFTFEAWMYPQNKQGYAISQRDWSSNGAIIQYNTGSPGSFGFFVNTESVKIPTTIGQWHHVVGTYDGTTLRLYVDGVNPTYARKAAPLTWPDVITVMGDRGDTFNRQYMGMLDEIRMSKVARSSAYVSTSYINQNNPSLFYFVGGQENLP